MTRQRKKLSKKQKSKKNFLTLTNFWKILAGRKKQKRKSRERRKKPSKRRRRERNNHKTFINRKYKSDIKDKSFKKSKKKLKKLLSKKHFNRKFSSNFKQVKRNPIIRNNK